MTRVHWERRGGRALQAHGRHVHRPEGVSRQDDVGICRALRPLESRHLGRDKRAGWEGLRGSLGGMLCEGMTWADLSFGRNAADSEMKVDQERERLEESRNRVQLLGGLRGQPMRGGVRCVLGTLGPSTRGHLRT